MSDENEAGIEDRVPGRTKIIAGLVGSAALILAAYAMLRAASPAMPPGQVAPAGHYSLECGWCHSLSTNARPIEVHR